MVRVVRRRFLDPQVNRSVARILKENVLCSMATVAPRKLPWINTAYYAYSPRFEFFFCSFPDSQHAENLRRNPSMAIAIFSSAQTWGKPDRGLQLFGTCREVNGRVSIKAQETYQRRFRGFQKWKDNLKEETGEFPLRFYRFKPQEVKIFDEPEFGAGLFVVSSVEGK